MNLVFKSPKVINSNQIPYPLTDFIKYVSRDTCLVRDEVWCFWLVDQGIKAWLHIPTNDTVAYYFHKKSAEITFKNIAGYLLKNRRRHLRGYGSAKTKLLKTVQVLNQNVGKVSDKKLASLYQNYLQAAYNFGHYIQGAWAVIYNLEPQVVANFPDQADKIMYLDEPIVYFNLKRDILNLPLEKVREKYLWLKMYNPHDTPYTLKELARLRKQTTKSEVIEIFNILANNKKQYRNFVKSLKNNGLRAEVELVHAYAFIKTDRMEVWRQTMYGLNSFYKHIAAKVKGLNFLDVVNLASAEIKDILLQPENVDVVKLRQRRDPPMFIFQKNKISVVSDKNLPRQTLQMLRKIEGSAKSLQGTIVCKGKVRGRACIILSSKDLKKVKKGDIFIASFTYPTFTPYMAKCSGIVTDEGGLTGHAAVVARELKIPCIIGAKSATQIFKDGDLVE